MGSEENPDSSPVVFYKKSNTEVSHETEAKHAKMLRQYALRIYFPDFGTLYVVLHGMMSQLAHMQCFQHGA